MRDLLHVKDSRTGTFPESISSYVNRTNPTVSVPSKHNPSLESVNA